MALFATALVGVMRGGERPTLVANLGDGSAVPPGASALERAVVQDGAPDPDALPDAVPSAEATSAPGQLLTRLPRAGDSYTDPWTGAVVMRLTDGDFPTRNGHAAVDYSNGGPYVSQVWREDDGPEHMTVVAYLWEQIDWWAIDVNLDDLTLHAPRRLPRVDLETGHAWSLDPETPRIWYYASGGALRRFDTAAMRHAESGRFSGLPYTPRSRALTEGAWLMTSRGDQRIKWEWSRDGSTYVVYDVESGTEVLSDVTGASRGFNESYLTRDGEYLVGVANGGSFHRLIRVSDRADLGVAGPDVSYVHSAVIDRYMVGYDTEADLRNGPRMYGNAFGPEGWAEPRALETGRASGPWYDPLQRNAAANHESAGWVFANGNGAETAWYSTSGDQGGPISGIGYCAWFICLYQPGADPPRTTKVKHLAYVDSRPGGDYNESAFAHLQPNGRGAVFNSVANRVEGRADLYLALIPRRGR